MLDLACKMSKEYKSLTTEPTSIILEFITERTNGVFFIFVTIWCNSYLMFLE